MILQLQAKVHGLGNLGVSTCTYPIFSEFKATFCTLPPSLPHDEVCEARGVVVICFGSSLLGQLRGSVAGWLVSCLVGWLVDWLVGWLVGMLVGWSVDRLA